MTRHVIMTAVGAVLISSAASSHAGISPEDVQTISLSPIKDNSLYEVPQGDPLTSNGAGDHLFAGMTLSGLRRRGLVAFDIQGNIPVGATILSASLELHMSQTISGPSDVSLHSALTDWGEGTSDAPGGEGGGAPATPGDATWEHTFFDGANWTTPGGDFNPVASATTSVDGVGFYNWTSATMRNNVQGWLDATVSNAGWVLVGNEDSIATAKRFDSRENDTVEFRPSLTIEYSNVPGPGSIVLLAAAGLVSRRRRRRA